MTFTIPQPAEGAAEYQTMMSLVGTLKGLANWSAPIDHIGFTDNSRFAHVTRNLGTGGHQIWRKSTDNSQLVAITDAGLAVTALTATSLTVTPGATSLQAMSATTGSFSSTLGVTGTSTLGVVNAGATAVTTLTASSTVQGTVLISTVSVGTAPLTVTSTTKVTNLNADLLDGIDSTGFLTPTQGDAAYVNVTGDTMTGALNIQAASALKLQGVSGLGGFFLNATNVADPVLEFKDASGDTTVTIGNSASTYQLDVTSDAHVTDDLTVDGDISGGRVVVSGTTFSGAEELRVIGQSRFEGDVTMSSGTLNVSAGNVDVQGGTGGQIRVAAVIVNAASLDASEELLVNGQSKLKGAVEITTGGMLLTGGANIDNITVNGTGTPFTLTGTSQTSTTVGAAGAASALPATPSGYFKLTVGATDYKVPYYLA